MTISPSAAGRRAVRPRRLHQVGALLADHVRGRHGVRPRNRGHDGAVYDPQPFHAVHPQLRIDHGVSVPFRAHFTRAALVVHLHGHGLHAARPIRVGAELQVPASQHGRPVQRRPVLLEGSGFAQLDRHLYALHDAVQVRGVREEVGLDHGFGERVVAAEPDLQSTRESCIS